MKIYQTCRICKAVNFNKSWHHGERVNLDELKRHRFRWVTRCPACRMIESGRSEGLIALTNIPARSSRELLRLIKDYTDRAYEKDCQDRLIKVVKQDPHSWIATTTDNQLANRLAQKIGEAFDHVNVEPSYSPEPSEKVRIAVDFLPLFYHKFRLGGKGRTLIKEKTI